MVQYAPNDGFWIDNIFQPIDLERSGCGYAINNIPDAVLVAEANSPAITTGRGRVWLVEANWFDMRRELTPAASYGLHDHGSRDGWCAAMS